MTVQNGAQAAPDAVSQTLENSNTLTLPGAAETVAVAEDVKSLPEWAQKHVRELRKENADWRKRESESESARKTAEEARLADEKKWQELAENRGKEAAALKQKADAYDALQARLLEQVKAEVAQWPDEVKGMAPAEEEGGAAWLAWAEKARPLAAKLTAPAPAQGNPLNPPAQGKAAVVAESVKAENAKFVGTRF